MAFDKNREIVEMSPDELFQKLKGIGMKESTMEVFQSFPQYSLKGDKDPRWKEKQYKIFRKGKYFVAIFYNDNLLYSFKLFGKEKQTPHGLNEIIWYVRFHDDDLDPNIIY